MHEKKYAFHAHNCEDDTMKTIIVFRHFEKNKVIKMRILTESTHKCTVNFLT